MKKEHDLDLIQRITDNYFFWQGYRLVPFGIVFLMFAVIFLDPKWLPDSDWITQGLPMTVLLISLFTYSKIGKYYHNHFGNVRGIPNKHSARDAIKWFIFYPALGIGLLIDYKFRFPVFVSCLAAAASIIGYWWSTGKGREHYLVASAAMAISAFLPTLEIVTNWKYMYAVFFGGLGIIYVVGGLLDHLALTRVFKQPEFDEEGKSI
ncbi:MAG: hypothetical protein ACOYXT_20750 [Bacteroidota bacterium]